MSRQRILHAGQSKDEDVCSLSIHARYVWALLPCHADREGRLLDRPFTLKLDILPTDQVDMNALLDELAAEKPDRPDFRPFIQRYQGADGRRYIQIRSFLSWQTPHKKEAASEIPGPPVKDQGEPGTTVTGPGLSREVPGNNGTEENRGVGRLPAFSREVPGKDRSGPPDPDPDPVSDPDPGRPARARDPMTGTTEPEHGARTTFTAYDLESLMRATQVRLKPELGMWGPGKWAAKSFDDFFRNIPERQRVEMVPEIRARVERFFRLKDEKRFTVERFLELWNSLASPSSKPVGEVKQAGGYPIL